MSAVAIPVAPLRAPVTLKRMTRMAHRVHKHVPTCPSHCTREWDLDERSETGAYRIVARAGYGSRKAYDKPRWWPFAFQAYKAIVQLIGLLALYWLAKKLNIAIP